MARIMLIASGYRWQREHDDVRKSMIMAIHDRLGGVDIEMGYCTCVVAFSHRSDSEGKSEQRRFAVAA